MFHSKAIIVSIENLYLFFNLKHKKLVIYFTVIIKGIRIKAFVFSMILVIINTEVILRHAHFCGWQKAGFVLFSWLPRAISST